MGEGSSSIVILRNHDRPGHKRGAGPPVGIEPAFPDRFEAGGGEEIGHCSIDPCVLRSGCLRGSRTAVSEWRFKTGATYWVVMALWPNDFPGRAGERSPLKCQKDL